MLNGLLLIDKPILFTSHDVVDAVRRVLGERRIGHAGTLDPMATGLLILMVGPSTALFDRLSGDDKTYEGVMTLGYSTATQDAEGVITGSADPEGVTEADIREQFARVLGVSQQQAPLYSAAKSKGRKGYEAARRGQGQSFTAPIKQIHVQAFDLKAFVSPDAFFSCRVSRGTYIRTLVSDIGGRIGVPATLTSLRRTACGAFDLSGAVTLQQLKAMSSAEVTRHLELQLDAASAKIKP